MTDFVFENEIYNVTQSSDKIEIETREDIITSFSMEKNYSITFMRNTNYHLIIVCETLGMIEYKIFVINLFTKEVNIITTIMKEIGIIKEIEIYKNILCIYSIKKAKHKITIFETRSTKCILCHVIRDCVRFHNIYMFNTINIFVSYSKFTLHNIQIDKIRIPFEKITYMLNPILLDIRCIETTNFNGSKFENIHFMHTIYDYLYYIMFYNSKLEICKKEFFSDRIQEECIKNIKKYFILVVNNTLCIKYYDDNYISRIRIPFSNKMNLQNKCVETIATACLNGKKNINDNKASLLPLPLPLLQKSILFYIAQNNSFFHKTILLKNFFMIKFENMIYRSLVRFYFFN